MDRADKTVFLYEDDKWLILNKPTGLSTYATDPGGSGCAEWLELHHHIKVYVCSRLDKGTSGILLFALTKEATAEAESIHERGVSEKTYYFISDRQSAKGENWTCLTPLDGKECETEFSFVRKGNGYFLYRALISRGRRHQIRRHAAESGVPLLGDKEYGGARFSRICLHCSKLYWPGVAAPIEAALPDSFEFLLAGGEDLLLGAALAYERRLKWLSTVTDAFRLVHRGELGMDARGGKPLAGEFSVDLFGSYLSVTGYDESVPADSLREYLLPLLSYLGKLFDCKGGIVRTNRLDPHKRKLFGEFALWGEASPDIFLVREGDML
ncbi:MAG: RNA pseudouridine synthase, partial [bacterium]|nr:RNA pseudouridine synthase [bacterium]